jgi:hypothetical protein
VTSGKKIDFGMRDRGEEDYFWSKEQGRKRSLLQEESGRRRRSFFIRGSEKKTIIFGRERQWRRRLFLAQVA